MIQILDNRNQKEGLEIDQFGYGKWYAYNEQTDLLVGCKYKWQAQEIKQNPENWDI